MLVEIDIDDDMGDKIAAANLKSLLECLENDYELRKEERTLAANKILALKEDIYSKNRDFN